MKRKSVSKLFATAITMSMVMASVTGCGGSGDSNTGTDAAADTNAATDTNATADTSADTDAAADTSAATDTDASAETEAPAETAEEEGGYEVLTDADGNVYDLGGMEIVIRDWWSPEEPEEPTNAYEEAVEEWRDWIQETYNFKIRQVAISDWASTPEDFVNYATTGGDENYIFILRSDSSVVSAMYSGLMYDLATLDCLDFSDEKWTGGVDELFSIGDSIYCMYALTPEARTGVYFNKRLLEEAGINPDDMYKWQESGEWTFDKCKEVLSKVQRDTDNDGVIDIYGTTNNNANVYKAAIFSNDGAMVTRDSDGKFVYSLEDDKTMTGLNFAQEILIDYGLVTPEDAEWDYYKTAFKNGDAALCFDDAYMAGQDFKDMEDDFGFVCFPKGPDASGYTNVWSNNPVAIPACYDAEKAWNLAFAYNLYTAPIPGYEDYEGWKSGYYANFRDTEAVDQTLAIMVEQGTVNLADVIPSLDQGNEFLWTLNKDNTPAQQAETIRNTWQSYIDDANSK